MPWYFAGPDAKPVGPFSVQELHERRVNGAVTPETYVLEHTGSGTQGLTWKRYREVFPTDLPPTTATATPAIPAPLPGHPLFPSAKPAAFSNPYHPSRPSNAWCAWGFGLGLTGFFLSFFCIGFFLALPSLVLCIVGLVQVRRNPAQSGQGLAVAGLILSSIAVLISLIIIASLAVPMWKASELTVTEQTSNDSD